MYLVLINTCINTGISILYNVLKLSILTVLYINEVTTLSNSPTEFDGEMKESSYRKDTGNQVILLIVTLRLRQKKYMYRYLVLIDIRGKPICIMFMLHAIFTSLHCKVLYINEVSITLSLSCGFAPDRYFIQLLAAHP